MKRYFINAPCSTEKEHEHHGVQVLGPDSLDEKIVKVYPNAGPTISLKVHASKLSRYWKGHDRV